MRCDYCSALSCSTLGWSWEQWEHLRCDGLLHLDSSPRNNLFLQDECDTEQVLSEQSMCSPWFHSEPSHGLIARPPPEDNGLPFHLQCDSGEAREQPWASSIKLLSSANLPHEPYAFPVTLCTASCQSGDSRAERRPVRRERLQSYSAGF